MSDGPVLLMAGDAGYAFPIAVALRSIRDHAGIVCPAVVVDFGLGREGRDIVLRSGFEVEFADRPDWVNGYMGASRFPPVYFTRLRPEVFAPSADRVLWLDGDILVRDDIRPLLTAELRGRVVGAAPTRRDAMLSYPQEYIDVQILEQEGSVLTSRMFNAGVLLFDMERWQASGARERVDEVAHRHVLSDQESLNVALWDKWWPLDRTWNGQSPDACIFHFAGGVKPWNPNYYSNSLLLEYRDVARSIDWRLHHPMWRRARARVRPMLMWARDALLPSGD